MYVIAVTNIRPGRFADETVPGEADALERARQMSAGLRRLAVSVYEIRGDGAYALATYLNGERRFTAIAA